jgi:UDP-N-acetylmuramoylalanine--D-glutamate ligase
MRNSDYFKGKQVTIVGLARSGLASANLLHGLGARVRVTDARNNAALRKNAACLVSGEIKLELGGHSEDFMRGSDLLVVSPGVENTSLPVKWAEASGAAVVSEIEVGFLLCPAQIIAVTGSSGKSTVTTLIAQAFNASGRRCFACGNIGVPFTAEVAQMRETDLVSLEISSFQLERIRDFKPRCAVMLNFSRNHLDRHADMRAYLEAKKRIFLNQDRDDFLVLNADDPALRGLSAQAKAKAVFFRAGSGLNEDQAAVVAATGIFGVPRQACLRVFRDFRGLPHRLEYVAAVGGVKFINDSKATVAEAAEWAIKNIDSRLILIAGGRDKGADYSRLLSAGRGKVKEVIAIGEAAGKIKAALAAGLNVSSAKTLEEAVGAAFRKASPGETVLLSPMCSSFDMFNNYEERGEAFKRAVYSLINSK